MSGCIIGECPFCHDLVYEDDWIICDDKIMHVDCRASYIREYTGMSTTQFEKLTKSQQLEQEIRQTREMIAVSVKHWNKRLSELSEELEGLKIIYQE